MNQVNPSKKHKCKVCKTEYVKQRPMQVICGDIKCMAEIINRAKAKRQRADRVKTKEKLEAIATKPELTKLAQKAFNAYIRARDYGKDCISCGAKINWGDGSTGGVCDAGHYLSVGARINLRFNEDNCHAQCKRCNNQLSGNAVNYRIGLINKIGLEKVEALESDHTLKKYTHDDLREIAKHYKSLTKQLKGNND